MAAKRTKAGPQSEKPKKKITRNRPKRPGVVFVRLFAEEEEMLRRAARGKPLATFVRQAVLAFVASRRKPAKK